MSFANLNAAQLTAIGSVLDKLPDALLILDKELRIIGSNTAADLLLPSVHPEETTSFLNFFSDSRKRNVLEMLSNGSDQVIETEKHWTYTIEKIREGFCVRIEKTAAEDSEAKHDFEGLFDKMPEGVIYEDANGLPILMNPSAEALLGLSLSQLRGETSIDPEWHAIYEDGRILPVEAHPTLISLRTGKAIKNEKMGIYNPKIKEYRWILINATPEFRPGEDQPFQVFATFTDITEQVTAEQKFKNQSELFHLLVSTSSSFINLSEDELQESIQISLQKLGEFVQADRMYVFEYNWQKFTCSNTYEWCGEGIEPQIEFLQETSLEGLDEWTSRHLKGEMMYIENVQHLDANDPLRHLLEPQGIKSLLAMPIMDQRQCLGFIGLDSVRHHHHYSASEISILTVFTGILANVKNRLSNERQLKERVKEFNTVYDITQLTINVNLSDDEILRQVVDRIHLGFFEPDITSARICYQKKFFESQNFSISEYWIKEKIQINGEKAGELEIFIPEGFPFLPEEHTLIQTIASILGQHFESKINLAESQKNEQQLKNLLNSQTSYVLRTNLQGLHTYWNGKFEEEFGWLYGAQGLGNGNSLQSICDYHHAKTYEIVEKCLKWPGKIFPVELDKPGRDGSIITTLWEFVALTDEDGQPAEIQCMGINITDRKKVENQLVESENRLRTLLQTQTNYVIRTDLRGRHTFWNKRFEEDFGFIYPSKGLAESDSLSSICDYDQDKARETVKKCIQNPGKVVKVELDKPTRSGKIINTLWDFVCLTDSQGNPHEMQCVGVDITEQKEAEQKIKESEEKYRVLFEESPEGYLIIKNGRFIDCNKAALSLLGHEKTEIVGISPIAISPEFQPDGQSSAVLVEEILARVEIDKFAQFEWVHRKKDGSEFLASILLSKIKMNGEDVIFTTWKDITKKRATERALIKSENRFRQIAEHTGAVIWETDHTGLYTFMGPVAKRIFGYDPEEIMGKKYFWELFPSDQQEELKRIGEVYLKKGNDLFNWENPIQRKDGEVIWVSSYGSAIFENGKIVGYRGADYEITARKIAELELQKFRIISDKATYGTLITGPDKRIITYCNESFAKMHGYEVEELIGQDIYILHTPEQLDYYNKNIYPEYEKNKEYTIREFGRKRKDGSTFPGLVTAKLFFDEQGKPLFNAATVIDISERKKQEELITEQNQRLQGILEAMPDSLFILDREGNYLEMLNSPKFDPQHIFTNAVGKNIRELFSKEIADIHFDHLKKTFDTGKVNSYEYHGIVGYETYEYEARMVAISDTKVLRLIRDITDRRKVEREIKKLTIAIEQSPVAIIITDVTGKLEYMSPAFLTMTGYTYEELYQKPIGIIKSGMTERSVYDNLWKTISAGKNWQNEWRNRRKNGEIFWENISITPILDEKGKIRNFLAVKQDITERKNYEEEIIQLNQNLEERIQKRTRELEDSNRELELARIDADTANQAKSEFLSRMSHELRTPMNSILGFAQLLQLTELSESQSRNLDYILKSGNHLLQLINEVLDIAKIESGKVELSIEPVEVLEIIREVTESALPFATKNSIQIHLPIVTEAKAYILADLQRLKQILINLLNNAIKYNREGGQVWVAVEKIEEGKYFRISVKDNGIGISESNLSKLFRPFERIGGEQFAVEGTGLGLSVVEKLTKQMNGRVGVKSQQGEGSIFWIELPISEIHPKDLLANLTSGDSPDLTMHHKGMILLVEDNPTNIELIQELIRNLNPELKLLTTIYGQEAIKLAKENLPSLILLDLNLPDISGIEVLDTLKNDPQTKDLAVIVVSADATSKQMDYVLAKGADQYLTKPVQLAQLIRVFELYLKKDSHE